jgi:carbon starvation protein
VALCVATTILVKKHRARFLWLTSIPLAWLVTVTYTAAYQKIFSPEARVGFLAQAASLEAKLAAGGHAATKIAETQTLIFNARLDAVVCGVFLILVTLILADSLRAWIGILRGTREAATTETPFVLSRLKPEEV